MGYALLSFAWMHTSADVYQAVDALKDGDPKEDSVFFSDYFPMGYCHIPVECERCNRSTHFAVV